MKKLNNYLKYLYHLYKKLIIYKSFENKFYKSNYVINASLLFKL